MFETLKKILLSEILEQVEYADKIYEEMIKLENELKTLKEPEDVFLYKPRDPRTTYGSISKILNYRNYKKSKKNYDLQIEAYEKTIKNNEEAKRQYFIKKEELENRVKELKEIWKDRKLEDVRNQYKKIKEADNVKELGYSFDRIQELFKKKNVPIVFDETDKIIINESNFDKLEDLVLVHKTNYAPTNNEIKTVSNSNVQCKEQINICGNQIEINYNLVRDTVHFAVNGEVGSHFYGSWDEMKYAVIIPFTEVLNIVNFSTGDTYTKGNVDISNGYLLCPEEEIDQIRKNNSNLIVIGYKGRSVDGIADAFITMLGYKKEKVSTHGWENKDSDKAVYTVLDKTNIKFGDHSSSIERKEEEIYTGINQFKAIIEQLLERKIDYDVELATNQLLGINEKNGIQLGLSIDINLISMHGGKLFTLMALLFQIIFMI